MLSPNSDNASQNTADWGGGGVILHCSYEEVVHNNTQAQSQGIAAVASR
jgi:hypothetical protein